MAIMNPVKFFCEFCGSQVRAADRICPHCGSFFSQVRCPACGFQGENKLFSKGCPVCGFATSAQLKRSGGSKAHGGQASAKPAATARGAVARPPAAKVKEPIPGWVLPFLLVLFLGVIALAVVVLQSSR